MRLSFDGARVPDASGKPAYGAAESPDTGLMVVPWVILDW